MEEDRTQKEHPRQDRLDLADVGVVAYLQFLAEHKEYISTLEKRLAEYAVLCPLLFEFYQQDPVAGRAVLREVKRLLGVNVEEMLKEFARMSEPDPEDDSEPAANGTTSPRHDECPYRETDNGLVYSKHMKEGVVDVLLCNFTARIVTDLCQDDGVETRRYFEIEAQQEARRTLISVPSDKFANMHWATEILGARAVLFSGPAIRDHARAAIQLLSQKTVVDRRVYTHTGWREINGVWVYLHSSGAIGPNGIAPGIDVRLPAALERYSLPVPPQGQALIEAVRASLRILPLMPKRIAYSTYSGLWRAPLGEVDCSLFLYGKTGKGKSEWAALHQQHFGPEMDRLHLPGNFSSTGNSLEYQAFLIKDAAFTVDDFCPTGSLADMQRAHKEADRIFRAQGNRSGRGRLTSAATLQHAKPPRGLIIGTGEDVPKGQSLQSRVCTLEISEGDMNWTLLTECQADAAAGLYAQAMAAYLQWLAPRCEEVRAGLKKEIQELRAQALQGAHRRTPEIVANLAVGLRYFLQFAVEAGAISESQREEHWQAGWQALGEAAQAQARFLGESDPARHFIELVISAIVSGEAHIADHEGGEPDNPQPWGWREVSGGMGENARVKWQPQGKRIGWVQGKEDLYLEPNAAFNVAQTLATRQGDALPITAQTLRTRLKEGVYLSSWEAKRQRNTVRRTIEGRADMEVLHLSQKVFTRGHTPPPHKPSGPSGEAESPPEEEKPEEKSEEKPSGEGPDRPEHSSYRPEETHKESGAFTADGQSGRFSTGEEAYRSNKNDGNDQSGRFAQNGGRPTGNGDRPEPFGDAQGFAGATNQPEENGADAENNFASAPEESDPEDDRLATEERATRQAEGDLSGGDDVLFETEERTT